VGGMKSNGIAPTKSRQLIIVYFFLTAEKGGGELLGRGWGAVAKNTALD
jgi:hypothetical protein